MSFSTFAEFMRLTEGDDRQFLGEDELRRFAPTVCGMANGEGGWVVLGVTREDGSDAPVVQGLKSPSALGERLKGDVAASFGGVVEASFGELDDTPPLLLVRVHPVEWKDRPVSVGCDYDLGVYRRVEGENFVSGRWAKFRLGLDSLERLRSDGAARGVYAGGLDGESVDAFRAEVIKRRPEWSRLSLVAFLSRSLVMSGGNVTEAGNLLLGRRSSDVVIEMNTKIEMLNLWKAYELLPGLTRSFSAQCAAAFSECFVNAMLHSDYTMGGVRVVLSGNPLSARMENHGLPRTWEDGRSECRNFRLMKMFQLFDAASGDGRGLAAVRRYQPGFRLRVNSLELTTSASLELEGRDGQ